MPLLSRKADYALVILAYLHHHPDGASAREVADRFSLSAPFTANILKVLARKGLVHGRRGLGGGYTLALAPEGVCLCDVLDALDEPFQLTACNHPEEAPPCSLESLCPVRGAMVEVHRRLRETLRTVTLADLFRSDGTSDCCTGTQYGLSLVLREREGSIPVS
jgi:Rrf2 family transcriptional regulator, cysteine metabolism repressor